MATNKSRLPRPTNTRWALYAIKRRIILTDLEEGRCYKPNGEPYTVYTNWCGYEYIRVFMHSTHFSFFVHKLVYLSAHDSIPKGKEIDHIDGNNRNNKASNLRAVTMGQNLRKRGIPAMPEPAF